MFSFLVTALELVACLGAQHLLLGWLGLFFDSVQTPLLLVL